jgi:hypothetical protein
MLGYFIFFWFYCTDFLGKATVHIKDIYDEFKHSGAVVKRLRLQEISHGEVVVRFELTMY